MLSCAAVSAFRAQFATGRRGGEAPETTSAASRGGNINVSAIAAENVSKHWTTADGEVRAVDRLSFAFDEGTLNVLLGPSGCGKSTTLRLIAGLEQADGGRILIGGRDVTALSPSQRNIAMVFQSYALFPHLSVAENIVFGLKVRKVAHDELARRLARTADLLGLSGLLDRKPSQLSGGQQQRVALGRAFIAEAPVCLMDEPLSNLDAQLRQDMRTEIRGLQRTLGITMVYVTHDQIEAMSMADRVVLLNKRADRAERDAGRALRKPGEHIRRALHRHAADEPAAARRGTRRRGRRRHRRPGGRAGRLRGLTLGVRPEHIALGFERGARADVAAVEYLGADSLVTCRLGAATLAVRVPGASASRAATPHGSRGRREHSTFSSAAASAAPRPHNVPPRRSSLDVASRCQPEENTMLLKVVIRALTGAVAAMAAAMALAQAPVEVSFYYPVAVGGPITKIIDGLAADFEKENPGIKLKPIYTGTYQDSITKALTAVKGGDPPVTSILLSTDMFTLIDEDAVVPFDDLIKTSDDQAWLRSFYPAFMENSQTGGKTWGIPFQRSTIVLYYNKEMFKEAGPRPEPPAGKLEGAGRVRAEAHEERRVGQGDAVGNADPVVGLSVLAVPGARDPGRDQSHEQRRHADLLRSAGSDRRAHVLGRPRQEVQGASGRHRRVGHDAEGLFRAQGRDDMDDHRQPHQRAHQRQVRLRRRDAARGQAARQPDRRRKFLSVQEVDAGAARRGDQVHQVGDDAAARGAVGDRHRLCRGARRRVVDTRR